MPKIKIENLSKRYGPKGKEIIALDNINLEIDGRKYHTLLGPSGCGKTTLLRIISGLVEASEGKIFFNTKDVSGKSTQERDIGFVFQQFAIFPHLDAWHNTAYGPMIKGWKKEEIEKAVRKNLELVGLGKRSDALPDELSGGMKQRLGLARALAAKPGLLLLDEPLSALDAKIGEFLRYELKKISKKNKVTAIHVSHNQEEAMSISDNIILMKKGRIVQTGTPEDLYEKPNSIFAANFIGKCNFFRSRRKEDNTVIFNGCTLKTRDLSHLDERVVIGVRPEKIHLDEKFDRHHLHGSIELINFFGHLYEYVIDCGLVQVRAYKRIKERGIKDKFHLGDEVSFWFYPDDSFVWPEPENFEDEINLE